MHLTTKALRETTMNMWIYYRKEAKLVGEACQGFGLFLDLLDRLCAYQNLTKQSLSKIFQPAKFDHRRQALNALKIKLETKTCLSLPRLGINI